MSGIWRQDEKGERRSKTNEERSNLLRIASQIMTTAHAALNEISLGLASSNNKSEERIKKIELSPSV